MILTFVLFGVTHTPDGPFRRPHPAFWRLILCLSIVYELALVFLLFQVSCLFLKSDMHFLKFCAVWISFIRIELPGERDSCS